MLVKTRCATLNIDDNYNERVATGRFIVYTQFVLLGAFGDDVTFALMHRFLYIALGCGGGGC